MVLQSTSFDPLVPGQCPPVPATPGAQQQPCGPFPAAELPPKVLRSGRSHSENPARAPGGSGETVPPIVPGILLVLTSDPVLSELLKSSIRFDFDAPHYGLRVAFACGAESFDFDFDSNCFAEARPQTFTEFNQTKIAFFAERKEKS
jgi:hypothetical protein